MYVLGIQYKEKWNKMAVIAVARCKFILAKKVICAQYRACLSLCQENYYEWGMDGMKFCIIHDYMLLNFIEESWSTPDIPDATKRSCIPHCWRQHIPPTAVISTTWLFVLRIKETNLKKDDREKLQIIELQALTPGGKGRNLLHLLSNNWKSAIASCFFLPNINLATLFM